MRLVAVLAVLLALPGCLDLQSRPGNEDSPVIAEPPKVTINVPPQQTVDSEGIKSEVRKAASEVKTEVQASSNNTQSNMSGLVNASVSKLGEKVTGVEAKAEANLTATNNMKNEMSAEFNANAVATANVNSKAEANLTATAKLDTRVEAMATIIAELRVEIGKVNATAQVGYNKMEQIEEHVSNQAGRDVNYLPKQAVQLMLGIITSLCGLATTIVVILGRNARVRERLDAERERRNSKHWQEVALKAIGELGPDKSKGVMASRDIEFEESSAPSTAERIVAWFMCLAAVIAFSALTFMMIMMATS